MAGTISVVIADGSPLFGDAVRAEFESHPDLCVVAVATDGMRAVSDVARLLPTVAIVDANLPNCDGVRATRLIREQAPTEVVLVADGDDEALLIDAVHAGAAGFVSREVPIEVLVEATRSVGRGEVAVPPRMLRNLLSGLVRRRHEQDVALRLVGLLTRRERQIVLMLAEGMDNERIAQELVISPETVRTHTQNLLKKLDLHSRVEAAAFVHRNRISEELQGVAS